MSDEAAILCAECDRQLMPHQFDAAQRRSQRKVCSECVRLSKVDGSKIAARPHDSTQAETSESKALKTPSLFRTIIYLLILLGQNLVVSWIGSRFTIPAVQKGGWYANARRAPWTPPDFMFGPVWVFLYLDMAVAAWLVWRKRPVRREMTHYAVERALKLYLLQLIVNATWAPVFFGLYPVIGTAALWIALAIIVVLDWLVFFTAIAFWPHTKTATYMMLPYWAWCCYATMLNLYAAIHN